MSISGSPITRSRRTTPAGWRWKRSPSSTPKSNGSIGASATEFRIFKGIESDILADGSLDYPDEVLASFDFVVASVHGRFKLSRKEQTERIVRAVQNPYTTILGHMTGRQLLRRPGYEVDVEKVLKACAKHGVAVEINANPWRLDLDWRWHRRRAGARLHDEHQPRCARYRRDRAHPLGRRDGEERRRAERTRAELPRPGGLCRLPEGQGPISEVPQQEQTSVTCAGVMKPIGSRSGAAP